MLDGNALHKRFACEQKKTNPDKTEPQQMQPTSDEVYKQINNALYDEQGNTWWDENQCLHLLKSTVNPARVGYFRRLLDQVLKPTTASALESAGLFEPRPRCDACVCLAFWLVQLPPHVLVDGCN